MSLDAIYMGSNVAHMRKLQKLSRRQLSSIIGTSIEKLTRLEDNQPASADYYLLEAIADYFGCHVQALVRDDMTKVGSVELRLRQLNHNIDAFEGIDMRTFVSLSEHALKSLAESGYFNYRDRNRSDL